MATENNNAADISINFGEAVADGAQYEGPKTSQGFHTMAKDGYYRCQIEKCEPGIAEKSGNGTLNLVLVVQDEDEKGTRMFGNVTCSGFSDKEGHRPNIFSLFDLLISAGRQREDLDKFASGKKQIKLGKIAEGLLVPGKNIVYARVRHEISTFGKMQGKEVTRVSGFTTPEIYAETAARGANRWDKKIDGVALAAAAYTSGLNGAGAKLSKEELDAASAGI